MSDTTTTDTPAKTRTAHNCACLTGTGQTCPNMTQRAFAQGHDARMSGRVAQAIADKKMTEDEGLKLIVQAGGGDLLVSKTKHSAKLRAERGNGPKTPKGPKVSKDVAEQIEKTPSIVGQATKVHHGQRSFNAAVVRNAKEELVARHRLNSQNCDHAVEVAEDGEVMTGPAL